MAPVRLDLCYPMAANRLSTHLGRLLLVACITVTGLLASEQHGTVKAGGLPVPGATVTATQGDKKVVTTTDDSGFYSFPDLADGVWTITVDSLGLVAASREIGVAPGAPSPEWDLKYETLEAIAAPSVKPAAPATAPAAPATSAAATPPAEKAAETATPAAPATAAATPPGKNAKNAKTPATTTANANGRPSLNAALAAQGQGQGGGFTRLNVGQTGDAASALDTTPPQDMSDMAADGNSSFTINGSVSSGLDMPQGPADWMMGGGRGGPGGMDFGGGGMGPGGIPGMDAGPGGDTGGGGRGGRGGGGPGGGGPGGGMGGPGGGFGGGRGGGGMAGIPNIGGGRGGRGGGPGGRGGRNPSAFGNNRRNPRSTYNFAASINGFTNSFLNARSFSETGQVVAKPSAQTLRSTLTAG